MEDLTDAITSLKCLLEEQLDTTEFPMLGTESDSLAVTLRKLMASNEKYMIELTEAVVELTDSMNEISKIQSR